jgi:glutamine synthetase adenylyltransferase
MLLAAFFETMIENHQSVALLALGSFGVGEPRVNSDVDVLVVSDGRDLESVTRNVQKMSQFFSESNLLKIDFRLRGEGANAPLVQDLSNYDRYFKDRMSPWERVAFSKCTCWGGDAALADAFFELLLERLTNPVSETILESLVDTRKQLEGLVPQGRDIFETKRSAGGRYDIEYLTSIALANIGDTFALNATTEERLEIITLAGAIPVDDQVVMSRALGFYQQVDYLMELQAIPLPKGNEKTIMTSRYLNKTFELLGLNTGGDVQKTLDRHKRNVRECFERFVASASAGAR